MKDDVITIAAAIAASLFVLVIAAWTIQWMWPFVIPVVFPGLYKLGYVASAISFKTSVYLIMFCSILFKSTNYTGGKK